jgi:uracil phosphoribosyltransferase
MVNLISHPLIQHKLFLMRNKDTCSKDFRQLAYEISQMLGYEAMRNLETKLAQVVTPLATAKVTALSAKKIALVPILRAGLIMADAISNIVPTAKVGHIGIYRSPETHEPVEYFSKLPNDISTCSVFLLDPMLATGHSAVAAIKILHEKGVKNITFVSILAAPEGVEYLSTAYPDMQIYTGAIDEKLNENLYIIPGLGDAGDRIFGTY